MSAFVAPTPQVMTTNLEAMPGVVVRQVTQMAEAVAQAVGLPFEAANEYAVFALPPGRKAAMEHSDPAMWRPTAQEILALPEFLHVKEQSSLCSRIGMVLLGCQNLRPLSLHFMTPSGHEEYRAQRPCKLGGGCCCPLEMTMSRGGVPIGKAMEDFSPYWGKCAEATYCCRFYHMAMAPVGGRPVPETGSEGLETRYTIRYDMACCGRVNNCCAVSCCAHNAIMDILDPKGQIVGNVQVTYAPDSSKACAAFCRASHLYNNFILDFPQGATQEDRALLLAALMNVEYHLFEKTGDDDN